MHASARPLPAALDASLWRASALAQPASSTVPSGHAALDVELPGAGWPRGSLSELLQVQSGLHEWRLLLPALRVALAAAPQQALVLIGSPHQANLPALACHGIAAGAVLVVEASQPAERLWAAEQALRCRDLAALLLWAPQARPEQLRRLQVAAQAAGQDRAPPLVFVCRPWSAQHESSPAPLRLTLRHAPQGQLALQLLKRRGPAHATPLLLAPALPPALRTQPFPALPPDQPTPDAVPSHVVDRPVALPVRPRLAPANQPIAA